MVRERERGRERGGEGERGRGREKGGERERERGERERGGERERERGGEGERGDVTQCSPYLLYIPPPLFITLHASPYLSP